LGLGEDREQVDHLAALVPARRLASARVLDGYSASMISTVAVGTDGSGTANVAVKEATEIARRFGAKLVLLSATSGSDRSRGSERKDIELQWAASSSARLRTILERNEADVRRAGIDCETHSDEGDPAEVLVRLAAECDADLLVIGNKGMKRRVLGSVPNTVTHKAECSVLVVKTI
jgi:nucleotide-binding universal stress UspA family protein